MTGTLAVLNALNAALGSELRAIAQYRQDAAVLENLNLPALAKYASDFAAQEAEHLGELLERLTFLDGSPAYAAAPTEYRGTVQAILTGNLALEVQARNDYESLVALAMAERDSVTRALAEDTEGDEEKHVNFWEGEIDLFQLMGEAAYVTAWKARG
jgi:bacterioferritin